ncbi:MAG: hypothetical protein GXP14_01860 [Gammaproteobacteria bacterium]|nr:hypothetical protein [Gammaproteobacteria bacterium]
MMKVVSQWCLLGGFGGMFCLASLDAGAALLPDSIKPYVQAELNRDNNLFRKASNEQSDTISVIGAGVNVNLELGRQTIRSYADFSYERYNTFDYLDNVAKNAGVFWNWRAGRNWWGLLAYNFEQGQPSFNQITSIEKDTRTDNRLMFNLFTPITPDWRLKFDLLYKQLELDKAIERDRDTTSFGFETQYLTGSKSYLGLRVGRNVTEFPNRETIDTRRVSNSYDENEYGVVARWEPTGRSSFAVKLVRTVRQFNEIPGDFFGTTGRVQYRWKGSSKWNVTASLWRQDDSLPTTQGDEAGGGDDDSPNSTGRNEEFSGFVLTSGVSVRPMWRMTSKIRAIGELTYMNKDINRDDNRDINRQRSNQAREDKIRKISIAFIYGAKFIKNGVDLTLKYETSTRDSDLLDYDYQYQLVSLKGMFKF